MRPESHVTRREVAVAVVGDEAAEEVVGDTTPTFA